MRGAIGVLIVTAIIAGSVGGFLGPRLTFERTVHAYMENAYYANTPELMIENLQAVKAGMQKLGLKQEMYGTILPWQMTPSNRMDFQYKHLDSIINRVRDVIKWRDGPNSQGTQATDVYEQKMDNLRAFLKEEGWSDDIAKGAFYANYHPWWSAFPSVMITIALVWAASFLIGGESRRRYI